MLLLLQAMGTQALAQALDDEQLPDIEVRALSVTVEKMSTNRKVLQLTTTDEAPRPRQLILIKGDGLPRIALRVIRNYEAADLGNSAARFAAQRVRVYDNSFRPELGRTYGGILKLRDIELAIEPPAKAEAAPVLEPAPAESETVAEEQMSAEEITEEEERELKILAYEEPPNYEPDHDAFGLAASLVRLGDIVPGTFLYLRAAGLRYSRTFSHPVWWNAPGLQDSLSFDFSALLGTRLEFAAAGDSYQILTTLSWLRYNLNFSEDLSVFAYTGLTKALVLSAVSTGDEALARQQIGLIMPALGVGAQFRVGPQWYLRLDIGIEQAGASLMLRY